MVGRSQLGTLPQPEYIGITGANENDGKVFKPIRPFIDNKELYGDKAYQLPDEEDIWNQPRLAVQTPIKTQKHQAYLDAADQLFSTAVSRIRQPIESLLAWLERKSGIESASQVRSYAGLLVHVFGKLAAAIFFGSY